MTRHALLLDRRPFWSWFAVGLIVAAVVQVSQLAQGNGPAFTLRVGIESPALEVIRADLGTIALTQDVGHDGQHNYLVARDPWGLDGYVAAADDPAYRLRRPLVGWMAGLFGTLPPVAALAGLSAVVALGFALGSGSAGLLAARYQLPRWAHLAVLGCAGLWLSLQLVTADAPMIGLVLAGVVLVLDRRFLPAGLVLAAAVLAKEVAMLSVIGLALWAWQRGDRRSALVLGIIPTGVLVAWLAWVHRVFGQSLTPKGNLDLPFAGIVDALPTWTVNALVLGALGLVSVVVGLIGAFRSASRLVWLQILPWTAMAILSSYVVWGEANNAPRVFAATWVAGVLGLAVGATRGRGRAASQVPGAPAST
jgi:hypothetical protein